MNLKEAFQAQNKIGELMNYITYYLSNSDNVMTVTEKHLRSKALAGQQDDTVDVSRKADEGFDVGRLLGIWQELMAEKERLGMAIGKAKAGMEFNLDAAVDGNKSRRAFLATLQNLANRCGKLGLKLCLKSVIIDTDRSNLAACSKAYSHGTNK